MDDDFRKISRTIWVGVGLLIVILCLSFVLSQYEKGRKAGKPAAALSQVQDFTLTNQSGQMVTFADLRGKVWVADIIFTVCAGPCPMMTKHMKEVQAALPALSQARLVTLTTDPKTDTPEILKAYAEKFEADPKRWMFLTGDKQQIVNLAVDGLKLTAVEKKPEERTDPNDLFIHSTLFVVVDKHGQLREVFQTTGEDIDFASAKAAILALVEKLEREQ